MAAMPAARAPNVDTLGHMRYIGRLRRRLEHWQRDEGRLFVDNDRFVRQRRNEMGFALRKIRIPKHNTETCRYCPGQCC